MILNVCFEQDDLFLNPKTKSIFRGGDDVIELMDAGEARYAWLDFPLFFAVQVSVDGHCFLLVTGSSLGRTVEEKDYLELYEAFGDKFSLMGFVWHDNSQQAHAKSIGMIQAECLAAATAMTKRDWFTEEDERFSVGIGLSLYTVQVAFDGGYKATVHRTRLGVTAAQER